MSTPESMREAQESVFLAGRILNLAEWSKWSRSGDSDGPIMTAVAVIEALHEIALEIHSCSKVLDEIRNELSNSEALS